MGGLGVVVDEVFSAPQGLGRRPSDRERQDHLANIAANIATNSAGTLQVA